MMMLMMVTSKSLCTDRLGVHRVGLGSVVLARVKCVQYVCVRASAAAPFFRLFAGCKLGCRSILLQEINL